MVLQTMHIASIKYDINRGRKIVKIRGAKICHAYVLHLSSWKDLLNDKRYGDYKNPILQYMYVHDNIHNNYKA